MFTTRSLLQELMQLLACLEVQVKPGKRQMRRYQQMISFNVGKKSNPDPQPVCLTLIRVEAWIYCINIHADVYLISSSGRLAWTDCGSLALTLRCWQIDRWPASCPLVSFWWRLWGWMGLFLRYNWSSQTLLCIYSMIYLHRSCLLFVNSSNYDHMLCFKQEPND